ncbi:hypothetical protein [Francisella philomiragia]|uniref:hypothetical protein n=1 Tax=Francisella philomiragia TaxID=28110 RepID=UPI0035135AFC
MTKQWAVIGGGVAGITAVAKLLDENIDGKNIHWICSDFCVGDLGEKWRNVSGNTSVKRVKDFLLAYESFDLKKRQSDFDIFKMPEDQTCYLNDIVKPLEYSTKVLITKVNIYNQLAIDVKSTDQNVTITLDNGQKITSNKAIVAIGAEPKKALYQDVQEIGLDIALDPSRLSKVISADDTVAVFGSSHSAILILKSLVENNVKKIVNFYIEDIKYAVDTPDGIINDNTGLKGVAAEWSREFLEQNLLANLIRVKCSEHNLKRYLPVVNKAIYSIGFERRKLKINGNNNRDYNKETGEIVENVYGFGIAYPNLKKDLSGQDEYQVGVGKFVKHINDSFDIWNS